MKYTITRPAKKPFVIPIKPPTNTDRPIIIQAQFGSEELMSNNSGQDRP